MKSNEGNRNVWFQTQKEGVTASNGVISTNHPLASSAGIEMYALGGNAFDAAVASLFALTVVEPMMISVFGAGFFVIRDAKTGKIETIDNYAVAPKAATDTMYQIVSERKPGQNIFETIGKKNMTGHLSVGTPGTLKAWEHINTKYGNLSFKQVIEPAKRLASNGYRASQYLAYVTGLHLEALRKYPVISKTFLRDGEALKPGSLVVMPDYAETLAKIAENGSDIMYRGEIGKAIVDDMEENGGLLTLDDLAGYELIMRDPVRGTYHDDYEIYAMAPGSSGGTHIIQMLNILENFDVASMGYGSADHLHLVSETLKIAFSDRQKYMGDPAVVDIPVKGLTSKEYAKKRSREITEKAQYYSYEDPYPYELNSKNTTHISAMDSEGNIVTATQTLNGLFGSSVRVPGVGITLNNCMALFDPRPGRANSVAGGKRMLSSMSPTIVMKNDQPYLCIGTPGGLEIFPSVLQAIVNIIDFKMTIQEAVEAPRIWTMGINGTPGEKLLVEAGFPDEVRAELANRGHEVFTVPRVAGGMNGVLRDPETGLLYGGACWRAEGTSMGISGGFVSPKALIPRPPV